MSNFAPERRVWEAFLEYARACDRDIVVFVAGLNADTVDDVRSAVKDVLWSSGAPSFVLEWDVIREELTEELTEEERETAARAVKSPALAEKIRRGAR